MADFVDCLVAFDLEAVQKHIDEMRPGGFIIFDNTSEQMPDAVRRDDVHYYEVPLAKIAKARPRARTRAQHDLARRASAQLIGMDPQIVRAAS